MDASISVALKQALYWGSFIYFPVALFLIWYVARGQRFRLWAGLLLIPLTLLAYARFVEPKRLLTVDHEVEVCGDGLPGTLRAAVVADFHQGLFGNGVGLEKVVATVNRAGVDLVLMPGDFSYYLKTDDLAASLGALSDLRAPAYAVMGNHDEGLPGEDVTDDLSAALTDIGITVLDPGEAIFSNDGKFLRIIGFRDYWAYTKRGEELGEGPEVAEGMPIIYLQHNPDMLKDPALKSFDLMVAGHTHGGQIYLPWITCALTFACDTLRYGYADTPLGKLFVTSGVGMVGLPLRFGVPPRVDILNLQLNRCREDIDIQVL